MLAQSNIIAISGLKNSGKDTAAKMLQYLLNAPKWARTYWFYKNLPWLGKINKKWKIKSFAHPIKKMLAVLLNRPVSDFDNREFKEKWYVTFPTLKLVSYLNVPKNKILSDNRFSKMAKALDTSLINNYYLSIRQLMQFFGTDIMRTYFGDGLWTWATLTANNIIVSDLRFKVEMDILKSKPNTKVIYINRKNCLPGQHASEQEVIKMKKENKYDFIIDNNKCLGELFEEIKKLI